MILFCLINMKICDIYLLLVNKIYNLHMLLVYEYLYNDVTLDKLSEAKFLSYLSDD